MFSVLLESRAVRPRRLNSTMMSTAMHGAAIAALVALSLPGRTVVRSAPPVYADTLRFVRTTPPTPLTAAPSRSTARTDDGPPRPALPTIAVPVTTPGQIPPIDLSVPAVGADRVLIGHGATGVLSE